MTRVDRAGFIFDLLIVSVISFCSGYKRFDRFVLEHSDDLA